MPPIYQPEVVAAAILRCCERPEREFPVTWASQKLLWGQKLSPRAGDLVLLRNGWKGAVDRRAESGRLAGQPL